MNYNHINRRDFLKIASILAGGLPLGALPLFSLGSVSAQSADREPMIISTFSIAAYHPETRSWGVAITSRALAVGIVTFAKASAGAIATQALPDLNAGNTGLDLLAEGESAQTVLETIIDIDSTNGEILDTVRNMFSDLDIEVNSLRDVRQTGIVDAEGNAAAFTGAACLPWAGHIIGDGFCCQGNLLAGPEVLEAVAETFTTSRGDFASRLLQAIKAGDEAGGDRRCASPVNSAALLVAKMATTVLGQHDRFIDLRVDNDEAPIDRLQELRIAHLEAFGS